MQIYRDLRGFLLISLIMPCLGWYYSDPGRGFTGCHTMVKIDGTTPMYWVAPGTW